MPICEKCGSYYVRLPCPNCSAGPTQSEGIVRDVAPPKKRPTLEEIESMEADLSNLNEEVERLRKHNSEYQVTIADLEEELKAEKEMTSNLAKLGEEKDAKIAKLEADVSEKANKVSKLETGLSEKTQTINQKDAKIADFETQISGKDGRITELESKASALEQQLNEKDSKIRELEGKTSEEVSKIGELETAIQLKNELEHKLREQEQKIAASAEETHQLIAKIGHLEKNVAEKNKRIRELESSLGGFAPEEPPSG